MRIVILFKGILFSYTFNTITDTIGSLFGNVSYMDSIILNSYFMEHLMLLQTTFK